MWKELSEKLNINRKVLGQYRKGSLTLPYETFKKLILNFSREDRDYFENNIDLLDSNWGMVKGGIAAYGKNKEFFEKGRQKAIKKAKDQILKFDINMPLSEDLSYFIGLFIGDGFTNKYQRAYITQFTGQYSEELDYYKGYISNLGNGLFEIVPRIRKDNACDCVRVTYCSKYLYNLIVERFKISPGRKSYDVLIPDEIMASNDANIFACIAGLYDAEGCFYFVNRKNYKKPYPILEFHINNPNLVRQISNFLINKNISNSSWKNKRIVIYGRENIMIFFKKVNVRNPKLLRKVPKGYV
tara:strand:+ start:786 stop:1682 length:897 start_codon:yes stop_codon:yes gene_type:complete